MTEPTNAVEAPAYEDDRPGCMRVHVAEERARSAAGKFTALALHGHANSHGLVFAKSTSKGDMGWTLAQHGLIDADGNLRDGFPAGDDL